MKDTARERKQKTLTDSSIKSQSWTKEWKVQKCGLTRPNENAAESNVKNSALQEVPAGAKWLALSNIITRWHTASMGASFVTFYPFHLLL